MADALVLNAVGDVLVDRDDPGSAFRHVRALLGAADLRFGNCEAVYSDTRERLPGAGGQYVSAPACFQAVRDAGFDVMSLANNHALDGGYSGLADNLALFDEAGISPIGAGIDLAAARRPALLEVGGLSIGLLAYTCVYPPGSGATLMRPGLATLNVHTVYRQEVGQPGTRPLVLTFLDPGDKASVIDDVERLAAQADFVVVSVHWGIHLLPAELTDYERELGRALVDAGADLVLGHHQHILKGIELHRGKPILYGLGNFVIDHRHLGDVKTVEQSTTFVPFYGEYRPFVRPEVPNFPFHPESRRTMIARAAFTPGAPPGLTILPCMIDGQTTPAPIEPGSAEFGDYLDYLAEITERASLNARFGAGDGGIVVGAKE